MINLKAKYGHIYRVTKEETAEIPGQSAEDRLWLYQIQGKYGHVYVHGLEVLGAYVRTRNDGSRRLPRLLEIPGVLLHQRGDHEARVVFPVAALEAVASILMLRRRRKVTDETRKRLAEMRAKVGKVSK